MAEAVYLVCAATIITAVVDTRERAVPEETTWASREPSPPWEPTVAITASPLGGPS
jgi:hypothetical protein